MDTTQERPTGEQGQQRRAARWSRHLARAVALILTVLALGSTVQAGTSGAATQVARGGSPGAYGVGKVHSSIGYNVERGGYYVNLAIDGPTVGLSPAIRGQQQVLVHTQLFMYGTATGWRVIDNRQTTATFSSGLVTHQPSTFKSLSPGYYMVRQYIFWGGNWVQVDYNHTSDYRCIGGSPARTLCTPYTQGYIYVQPVTR